MSYFQERVKQRKKQKDEARINAIRQQQILAETIPEIYGFIFTDVKSSFSTYGFGASVDSHGDVYDISTYFHWKDFVDSFKGWLKDELSENSLEVFTEEVNNQDEIKKVFFGTHDYPKVVSLKTDDDGGILLLNECAAQLFSADDFIDNLNVRKNYFGRDLSFPNPYMEIVSEILRLLEQIHLHYFLRKPYNVSPISAHNIATCFICGLPKRDHNPEGLNIQDDTVRDFFKDAAVFREIRINNRRELDGILRNKKNDFTAIQAAAYYSDMANRFDAKNGILKGEYGHTPAIAKKVVEYCELHHPTIWARAYVCPNCGADTVDVEIFDCQVCDKSFCSKCVPIKREFEKDKFTSKITSYRLLECPFCHNSKDEFGDDAISDFHSFRYDSLKIDML